MLVLIPLAISAGAAMLSYLFKKPVNTRTAGATPPNSFDLGDAAQGVGIPYLCGTYQIVPNITWYGRYFTRTTTETQNNGKAGSASTETSTAYLSALQILCLGPLHSLEAITADDVSMHEGSLAPDGDFATLDTPIGPMHLAWGTANQPVMIELGSSDVFRGAGYPANSALRNVAYLFTDACQLNTSFNFQRFKVLATRYPTTPLSGSPTLDNGVNPAHFLWDLLVNRFAGSRFTAEDLDLDAFNEMALTMSTEATAVNVLIQDQSLKDVLTNFQAEFDCVFRLRDGKLSPKLIRDDYDVTTLPVLDESNGAKLSRRREPYGSAPNDCVFHYVNEGLSFRNETIELLNLGSLSGLGRRQTYDMTLKFVTSPQSAAAVAARKSKALTAPVDSYTMDQVQARVALTMEIGDPVKVTSQRLGISGLVCRVTDITQMPGDLYKLALTEDSFRVWDSSFVSGGSNPTPIGPTPPPPGPPPTTNDYFARVRIFESPVRNNPADPYHARWGVLASRGSDQTYSDGWVLSDSGAGFAGVWSSAPGSAIVTPGGVLVQDYPDTPKIDRLIGLVIDADGPDMSDLSSLSEAELFNLHLQVLINEEVLAVKTLMPLAGGATAGGRWHLTGIIRGLVGSESVAHASGSVVFVSTELFDSNKASGTAYLGTHWSVKAAPRELVHAGSWESITAVGPYTLTCNYFAPYPVLNLKANGLRAYATYSTNIQVTFDYSVTGFVGRLAPSGTAGGVAWSTPDAAPHEGVFDISVEVSGTVVRTISLNSDDTAGTGWTYTAAMNVADNGYLASQVIVHVVNRKDVFRSIERTITVRKV